MGHVRHDNAGFALAVDHALNLMDDVGEAIADEYAAGVGIDTGDLKASIRYSRKDGSLKGRGGSEADHAVHHEYGTGPHAIPNAFGMGRDFGTSPTFHPGTSANPALRRALMKRMA